jgi:ATP-binding cassette, subfamily B, bacterial MsbA
LSTGTRKAKKLSAFKGGQGDLGQKEALKRLLAYVIPLKGILLIGFLFTLAWSAVNLGYGKLAKDFLDAVKDQAGSHDMKLLNYYTAAALFVFVARAAVYFGMNYAWAYAGQKLTMRLRNEVFAHLQGMSLSFFHHRKTGELMSCISNDIPTVTAVFDAIQDCIYAPVVLVGGVVLLFFINWPLALISVICLPPTAWIIAKASRRIETYTGQLLTNRAQVLDLAEETLGGIRVVKSFGNEEYEVNRFCQRSYSVFRSVLRTLRVRLLMRPAVELLGAVAIILVLWVGGSQIIYGTGNLTFGKLTWFVIVLQQLANAARDAGNISVNLSAAGVAADRIFTLLAVKSETQEKPDAIELERVQGRVAFENVGFAYSPGIPVLEGISFTMEPGEVVALVGPTGSGKTTIAALIPRFYDVTQGAIRVDGHDIRDCTLKSLRSQIGIVPQDTVLFAGTIRGNIAYGRLDATEEEIVAAAQLANATEFIDRFPEGLDTPVGERGVTLSGGQRQRIAIARAVLRDPRILILDEATSSLDTQSEALVQDALQKVMAHRTTLVIAHRLSTVRNADKILVLKDGHIIEAGRHEELIAREGVYSVLYRTQFRSEDGPINHGPFE